MDQPNVPSLQKLLNSSDGKKLIEILKKDGSATLKQAAIAAQNGDHNKAYALLAPLLKDKNTEQLLDRIRSSIG